MHVHATVSATALTPSKLHACLCICKVHDRDLRTAQCFFAAEPLRCMFSSQVLSLDDLARYQPVIAGAHAYADTFAGLDSF
jgi:hypothetical protein